MPGDEVVLERAGSVAVLTLNRPERLNAISLSSIRRLKERLEEVRALGDIRACLILGRGRGFCAGGDVEEMRASLADSPQEHFLALTGEFHDVILTIRRMDMPVIAGVNGIAAGGGFGLALACDIRIAARSAGFKPAYSRIGVSPDGGITYFLPRIVGEARALDILFADEVLDAETSLRLGLVSRVVPDDRLREECMHVAERVAGWSPISLSRTKRLIVSSSSRTLEDQLAEERLSMVECVGTADFREGITSFFEKRGPVFKGK